MLRAHPNGLRTATLCSLAALAFIGACVAHEAVGHGFTCLAAGGRVVLLTSVYFRCQPGAPLVDAAGPLMNLVVAATAAIALRVMRGHSNYSVFLALLVAFSGLWGAGYDYQLGSRWIDHVSAR